MKQKEKIKTPTIPFSRGNHCKYFVDNLKLSRGPSRVASLT